MIYTIEFELPDNETVIKNIKTARVSWSVWGYSGVTHAQPVDRVIKQTLDDAYRHGETEAEARFHAEIVRCKDYKHQLKEWRADKRLKDKGYMVCGCEVVGDACGYWALLGQDDDYCSMAERRTDEAR